MQALLGFGKSIRQFKNPTNKPVFPQASTYPQFFDKHLIHPLRRIKIFTHDPNATIRTFYFQYLMLCFQIQNQNYQFYISKLKKFLLDPNFLFLFLEDDDQQIFNDRQFKRFLLEFMEILDSGEFQTTENAINAYPIADLVFVYFFRSLAIYAEITQDFDSFVDKTVLFGFLLENFNIDAQIFQEKCIKFVEAEIFVYEESPEQVYMVYKDIQTTLSSPNTSKLSKSSQSQKQVNKSSSSQKQKQQPQQNISMLQAQLLNSQTNSIPDTNCQNTKNQPMVDSGFKKNKILDNSANYKRLTQQFQQKPSVLSRNQEFMQSLENGEQIEYSFKNSQIENDEEIPNSHKHIKNKNESGKGSYLSSSSQKQKMHTIEEVLLNNSNSKNSALSNSHSFIHIVDKNSNVQNNDNHTQMRTGSRKEERQREEKQKQKQRQRERQKQKQRQKQRQRQRQRQREKQREREREREKQKQRQRQRLRYQQQQRQRQQQQRQQKQRQQRQSYKDSLTTGIDLKQIGNSNESSSYKESNNQYSGRERAAYSYFDSKQQIALPLSSRNHSTTVATPFSNFQYKIPTPKQSSKSLKNNHEYGYSSKPNMDIPGYPQKKHQIEQAQQKFVQYPYSSSPSPSTAPLHTPLNNDYYESSKNKYSSVYDVHIAPTRDTPYNDYNTKKEQFSHKYDLLSTNTAHTSSKESFTQYNSHQQLYNGNVLSKNNSNTNSNMSLHNHHNPVNSGIKHQQQYQIQPQAAQQYPQKAPLISKKEDPHLYPQPISLYNPHSQGASTLAPGHKSRDMRQESLSSKQKVREFVIEKLSVSKQFTDSLTLMKMGEPYNSNIKRMKTRSREFRESVLNALM